jgi:nucleoside-diphosphate-sugar epimerase/glyoxylase-like metal-dependent hydrolase (beta-lactamase superfamily II)
MRIAVTGATGFLGGRTARYLRDSGFNVIGTGRDPFRGAALEADGIPFFPIDLVDGYSLETLFGEIDVVIHCAALATAWAKEAEYRAANVDGTSNVVAACESASVRRLVHISTPAVLSTLADQFDLDEQTIVPSEFTSLYGASKAEAERVVSSSMLETAILRPKAIYGPGDTALLPRLLDVAERGRLRIIGDGATVTHFTHVDDVVQAIHRAVLAAEVSGVYHIAGPDPVDLWNMLSDLLPRFGYQLPSRRMSIERALRAARFTESIWRNLHLRGEPPMTVYKVAVLAFSQTLDTSRAKKDLGFEPTVSVQDGMASVLDDTASAAPPSRVRASVALRQPLGDPTAGVTFLSFGTVRPSGWLVGLRSRSRIDLPLISALLASADGSVALFDVGYGPDPPANAWKLGALYRWIVQPRQAPTEDALRRSGIDPKDVDVIVISHFHPDHYGGLSEFPNAEIVVDAASWASLSGRSLRPLRTNRAMLPTDIQARVRLIDPASEPFDLFGNGSVILRHLPGHSHGQIGADVMTTNGRYMLCGDAVWTRAQLRANRPGISRWIAEDGTKAAATIEYLRSLGDATIVPSHCPESADELLGPAWRSGFGQSTATAEAQR